MQIQELIQSLKQLSEKSSIRSKEGNVTCERSRLSSQRYDMVTRAPYEPINSTLSPAPPQHAILYRQHPIPKTIPDGSSGESDD